MIPWLGFYRTSNRRVLHPPGHPVDLRPNFHKITHMAPPRGSGVKSNLSPRWGSDSEIASTSRNVIEPAGDKEGVRSASACRDTPRPKKTYPAIRLMRVATDTASGHVRSPPPSLPWRESTIPHQTAHVGTQGERERGRREYRRRPCRRG